VVVVARRSLLVVVALLLLTSLLAGCSSSKGTASSSSSSATLAKVPATAVIVVRLAGNATPTAAPKGNATGNATGNGGNGTGNATAHAAGAAAGVELKQLNHTVQATVKDALVFDASRSNGTAATYSWDFGDKAKGTNVTERHQFAAKGLYNVSLTVIAGGAFAKAYVLVNVSAGGPPPGLALYTQHLEFSGDLPLGNPNSPTTEGTDYVDLAVPINATTPNGTGIAKAARLSLHPSGGGVSMFLYWMAPDGTELGADAPVPDTGGDKSISYDGTMPPGAYVARVRLFLGAQASFTLTVDVDYVTP
jgi:hypothetical protein